MADNTNSPDTSLRNSIAVTILKYGTFVLGAVAVTSIVAAFCSGGKRDPTDVATNIFTTLLPVISTWVGTVIAFYFGKENFESASRQINNLVNKITPEMYKEVPVKQVMIDLQTMTKHKVTDKNTLTLNDIDQVFLADPAKGRLPVLDNDCKPIFIIHQSELNKLKSDPAYNPATTLISFHLYGFEEPRGFVVIPVSATLNDAQQAIKKIPGCHDVFITKTGTANEELLGWLTDSRILDFLA